MTRRLAAATVLVASSLAAAAASANAGPSQDVQRTPARTVIPAGSSGPSLGSGFFDGAGTELLATWRSTGRPPLGVLVDPTEVRWIPGSAGGSYLVTDAGLQRVQVFMPDGRVAASFGQLGDDPGQLLAPVSADAEAPREGRRLVVADSENHKLVLFDFATGAVIGDVRFPDERPPALVAFRPDGIIEAYDQAFAYAYLFDRDGKPIRSLFHGGERIAFAWEQGNSMLRAYGNTLERMLADGTEWRWIDSPRQGPVEAIAAAPVRGLMSYAARKLSWYEHGALVLERTMPGGVRSIASTVDENLLAAMDSLAGRPAGLYRLNLDGPMRLVRWGDPLLVLGWIGQPIALSVSGTDVYVVDGLNRVQRFDGTGTALGQLRLSGLERAEFDSRGDAYVSRTLWGASTDDPDDHSAPPAGHVRHLIERWTFDGALNTGKHDLARGHREWSVSWDEPLPYDPARTTRIVGLDIDEEAGTLVALDGNRGRLLHFALTGGTMDETPLPSLAGRPGYADVVAHDGTAIAIHTGSRRGVLVREGAVAREFDLPPVTVRATAAGDHLVLASGTGWMWALDRDGAAVSAWPSLSDDGNTSPPSDVAIDSAGVVYSGDHAAASVRTYSIQPGLGSFGSKLAATVKECSVDISAGGPAAALTGQSVEVSVSLATNCTPLQTGGRLPDFGLRHAHVTLTVPDGVEVVPGSARPPALDRGRQIEWQLDWLPPASRVSVRVRSAEGTHAFPEVAISALDGWFGFHTLSAPGPILRAVPTAPGAYLPRLIRGAAPATH